MLARASSSVLQRTYGSEPLPRSICGRFVADTDVKVMLPPDICLEFGGRRSAVVGVGGTLFQRNERWLLDLGADHCLAKGAGRRSLRRAGTPHPHRHSWDGHRLVRLTPTYGGENGLHTGNYI